MFGNEQDSFPPEMQCRDGGKRYYSRKMPPGAAGNFSVRVRAITPAGNGSWSPVALFSLQEREKATSECLTYFSVYHVRYIYIR